MKSVSDVWGVHPYKSAVAAVATASFQAAIPKLKLETYQCLHCQAALQIIAVLAGGHQTIMQ